MTTLVWLAGSGNKVVTVPSEIASSVVLNPPVVPADDIREVSPGEIGGPLYDMSGPALVSAAPPTGAAAISSDLVREYAIPVNPLVYLPVGATAANASAVCTFDNLVAANVTDAFATWCASYGATGWVQTWRQRDWTLNVNSGGEDQQALPDPSDAPPWSEAVVTPPYANDLGKTDRIMTGDGTAGVFTNTTWASFTLSSDSTSFDATNNSYSGDVGITINGTLTLADPQLTANNPVMVWLKLASPVVGLPDPPTNVTLPEGYMSAVTIDQGATSKTFAITITGGGYLGGSVHEVITANCNNQSIAVNLLLVEYVPPPKPA